MPRYVEAKVQKRASVQCEHCGRQYDYTYVGKATSDVGLLEFSSRQATGRAAQAAVKDESANFHRCPSCGRYQSWMIQHAKNSAALKGCTWGCVSALILPLALVLVVFGLSALLDVEADQVMDVVSGPLVLVFLACFGLSLVYYVYRRFVWNPNSERARSRALRTGKPR
jgi:hypothetical protein